MSLSFILSLFQCWFCCSISVHRPESFIPDEFAVVTVVKISSLLISLNPKKLFIPIETLV